MLLACQFGFIAQSVCLCLFQPVMNTVWHVKVLDCASSASLPTPLCLVSVCLNVEDTIFWTFHPTFANVRNYKFYRILIKPL